MPECLRTHYQCYPRGPDSPTTTTHSTHDQLTFHSDRYSTSCVCTSPVCQPISPVPAALFKQQARPKLPSPLDFSSEWSSGQAFFNFCTLYLRLAPEQFSCNKEKILWTLTFFKDRRATRWSENLFHQEADTGVFPIQSWADFKQQFWSQFFPVNMEAVLRC